MTLDTVETTVDQTALCKYLDMLDKRGEIYCFIVNGNALARTVLELSRDGCADGVQLELYADGTWKMISHIVVGETENV